MVLGALAVLLVTGAVVYRAALGLAVLGFFYPWDLTTRAGPVKLTTSAALLTILFLVWAVREAGATNSREGLGTPLDMPVLLFAGATVLSLVTVFEPFGDPDAELVGLLKAVGGFLVFFLATRSLRDRRDLWLVIGAVLATGLIQAATTVIPIISGSHPVSAVARASGTTIHANLFAGYLLLIIPIVIALAVAVAARDRWALPLVGAATAVYGTALIATLSRSGLVGLAAGTATLMALLPGKRKQVGVLAGALLIAAFLAGLVGPFVERLAEAEANATTLDGRLLIWGRALQIFLQHFVFGVGVENFQRYIGNPSLSHAHNLYLNIAAERGLLGLATFCAVVIGIFRTLAVAFRKAPDASCRMLTAGLIAGFVAFFAHSMFDATYYDYKILLLFWLIVGVAASLPRLFRDDTPITAPRNAIRSDSSLGVAHARP